MQWFYLSKMLSVNTKKMQRSQVASRAFSKRNQHGLFWLNWTFPSGTISLGRSELSKTQFVCSGQPVGDLTWVLPLVQFPFMQKKVKQTTMHY